MGADGPIVRDGARVLLLDGGGRLLVLRGHDPHEPGRAWWFAPGGGIEPGESPRAAAVRELGEETGYAVPAEALVGPVWERTAMFDFKSRAFVQHEVFFVARLADPAAPAGRDWTADELEVIDEVAWLDEQALRETPLEVFPPQLRQSWDEFAAWDGVLRDLGTVEE